MRHSRASGKLVLHVFVVQHGLEIAGQARNDGSSMDLEIAGQARNDGSSMGLEIAGQARNDRIYNCSEPT